MNGLTKQVALHAVQLALSRANGVHTTLEHSVRPLDHVLSCDALAFGLDYNAYRALDDGGDHACLGLGAAHREAIEICFAVSCCDGYSFQENRGFWKEALSLSDDDVVMMELCELDFVFPPIVFHWDFRQRGLESLALHLRGFFGLVKDSTQATRSEEYCMTMKVLTPFMVPERWKQPIQCSVDLTGAFTSHNSVQIVMSLLHQIIAPLHANSADDGATAITRPWFMVRSVRCGEIPWNYEHFQELLNKTPAEIEIVMASGASVFDSQTKMSLIEQCRMWKQALGFVGSSDTIEWQGRLHTLDLVNCSRDCLAAVCSLLPCAQSMHTLAVKAASLSDWFWLGYALFHPRSQLRSTWHTLHVTAHGASSAGFAILELCHQSHAWSLALAVDHAAPVSTASRYTLRSRLEQHCRMTAEQQRSRGAQYATIHTTTGIFHLARDGACGDAEQCLRLPQGTSVELCETIATTTATNPSTTALSSKSSGYVWVVVAGYGVGRMRASSLRHSPSPTTRDPFSAEADSDTDRPFTCISTLSVADVPRSHLFMLVNLLAPQVEQLTFRGSTSKLLRMADVAHLPASLQTLTGCAFTKSDCVGNAIDFSAATWRTVHSIEISCETAPLAELLMDTLVHANVAIRSLTLRVTIKVNPDVNAWPLPVPVPLDEKLTSLIKHSPRLQTLVVHVFAKLVGLRQENMISTWRMPSIKRGSGTRRPNLAFLACVYHHHQQTRTVLGGEARSALARLGADVLHSVFAFVGHVPDYFLVHDVTARRVVFAGQTYRLQRPLPI